MGLQDHSDLKGNIERYNARLVAKGYTQNDGIDYKETFSPNSKKGSLRIVMCDTPNPGGPLTTHQLAKDSWMSGNLAPHH